jgi:hypothetical protein
MAHARLHPISLSDEKNSLILANIAMAWLRLPSGRSPRLPRKIQKTHPPSTALTC